MVSAYISARRTFGQNVRRGTCTVYCGELPEGVGGIPKIWPTDGGWRRRPAANRRQLLGNRRWSADGRPQSLAGWRFPEIRRCRGPVAFFSCLLSRTAPAAGASRPDPGPAPMPQSTFPPPLPCHIPHLRLKAPPPPNTQSVPLGPHCFPLQLQLQRPSNRRPPPPEGTLGYGA